VKTGQLVVTEATGMGLGLFAMAVTDKGVGEVAGPQIVLVALPQISNVKFAVHVPVINGVVITESSPLPTEVVIEIVVRPLVVKTEKAHELMLSSPSQRL
jgi:hypothetical protein